MKDSNKYFTESVGFHEDCKKLQDIKKFNNKKKIGYYNTLKNTYKRND